MKKFILMFLGLFMLTGCIDLKDLDKLFDFKGSSIKKWENGEVYYAFMDEISESQKAQVRGVMNEIEDDIQGIYFLEVPIEESDSSKHLYISYNNNDNVSEASIGKKSYNYLKISTVIPCYLIKHELFHILGLTHEHQRPDRDKYIKVYYENIKPGAEENFALADPEGILYDYTQFGYDYTSLMHYNSKSFCINDNKSTITDYNRNQIPINKEASVIDIRKIKTIYGLRITKEN